MNVFDQTVTRRQLRTYQLELLNRQLLYAVERSPFTTNISGDASCRLRPRTLWPVCR